MTGSMAARWVGALALMGCATSTNARRGRFDTHGHFVATMQAYRAASDESALPERCRTIATAFEVSATGDPPHADLALINAAAVWVECGDSDKAAALLTRVVDRSEGLARARALHDLAAHAEASGDLELAWARLQQALVDAPRWAVLHDDRWRLALAAYGRSDDAVWRARIDEVVAWIEREQSASMATVARLVAAQAAHRRSPSSVSSMALRQQLEAALATALPPTDAMRLRLIQGDLALEEGRIGEALGHYGAAQALAPDAARPHAHLALVMGQRRDYGAALEHLDLALRDPTLARSMHVHAMRAVALTQLDRLDEAASALRRAEVLAGNEPGARLYVERARQLLAERGVGVVGEDDENLVRTVLVLGNRYLELLPQLGSREELAALRRRVELDLPGLASVCADVWFAHDEPLCARYGVEYVPPPPRVTPQELYGRERQLAERDRERLLRLEREAKEAERQRERGESTEPRLDDVPAPRE